MIGHEQKKPRNVTKKIKINEYRKAVLSRRSDRSLQSDIKEQKETKQKIIVFLSLRKSKLKQS